MTERPVETLQGPNGVVAEIREARRPYGFENLLELRVTLLARVPGASAPFRYELSRLGVTEDEADRAVGQMVERCRRNLLPYLFRPEFPERFRAFHERKGPKVIPFGAPR